MEEHPVRDRDALHVGEAACPTPSERAYTTEKLLQNSKVVWYYGAYAPNSIKGQNSDVEIRKVIP